MPEKIEKTVNIEILSITIESDIVVCYKDSPVKHPQWKKGLKNLSDGRGSKRAGVFIISGEDKSAKHRENRLLLKIRVTGLKRDETVLLTGTLEIVNFLGTITGSSGNKVEEKSIFVVAQNPPDHFRCHRGNMEWSWRFKDHDKETPQQAIVAITTMEIYWIYDYPGIMFKKGVWVEVLRLLALQCYYGLRTKKDVIQRIVNYCHSMTLFLQYDISHSRHPYTQGSWGGGFKLRAFLEKRYQFAVCFDQAGLLQTLLGAIGIHVKFAFMRPYGYLNTTNLFGRGRCNNTAFLGNSPAPEIFESYTEANIKKWEGFGCHTFCLWQNNEKKEMVLDSCVGPHMGTTTKEAYINNSINKNKKLYQKNSNFRQGKVGDISVCGGITDVHSIPCSIGACVKPGGKKTNTGTSGEECGQDGESDRIVRFKKKINYEKIKVQLKKAGDKGVICDWPSPHKSPKLSQWKLTYQDIRTGCEIAAKEWGLTYEEDYLKIEIFLCSKGSLDALERLLDFAATNTMPEIPFENIENTPGHVYITYKQITMCLFYNVIFRIESSSPDIAPHLMEWFIKQAKKCLIINFQRFRPALTCQPPIITGIVGEPVTIKIFPPQNEPLDSFLPDFFYDKKLIERTGPIQLVEEKRYKNSNFGPHFQLSFKCYGSGTTEVFLALINKSNLLCSFRHREYFNISAKSGGTGSRNIK